MMAPPPARVSQIPNLLTAARLVAIPVLVVLIAGADGPTAPAAAWLFAAVALTDLLDGWLARRLHAESELGRIADPLADRLLVAVGLIGLIALGRFSWPGPVAILARDALLIIGFVVLRRRGLRPAVDLAGKASSLLAMAAVALALLSEAPWIDVLFWLAVAVSLATLANYLLITARDGWPRTGEGM
jgi:CDP-diacylglycerol--glycerol-3-phosphate 3-phosphatidyltransferase